MKKTLIAVLALTMFATSAFAYNYGFLKIDPNSNVQKMNYLEWYGNKKPILFGDKPEAALFYNKKDANTGLMQLAIDTTGFKGLFITPKSLAGMPLPMNLSNDSVGFGLIYQGGKDLGLQVGNGGAELHSSQGLNITSNGVMEIDGSFVNVSSVNKLELSTITDLQHCDLNQFGFYTGQAGPSLCYCYNANTWGCAPLASMAPQ